MNNIKMSNKHYIDEPDEMGGVRRIAGGNKNDSMQDLVDKLNNHDRLVEENNILTNARLKSDAKNLVLRLENEKLKAITNTKLGVGDGDGNGNLFVCGDYDSIKACQSKLLEIEKLKSALKQLTDKDVVDLMRCGIGGNYGGTFYDIQINKLMIKVDSAKLLIAGDNNE